MNEIDIEELIEEKLRNDNLNVYSIFYTKKEFGGSLSITFYHHEIIELLLNKINYEIQCDKTGYLIYDNTIILYGMALTNFINNYINAGN